MTCAPEADQMQLRTDIHETLTERADWFDRNYDIISHHAFGPKSERLYLGDKTKRVCRYCGLAAPKVKFRKLAHAIPDQVGNSWLFDHEECDTCNELFAKRVEDDFAKWTLPWRSMGRIKGKNGIPSLRSNDKQFRVEAADATQTEDAKGVNARRPQLKIQMAANDVRHQLDEATNTVKLTLERQPYVPMGVFKCLVKMAVAVMPAEEVERCAHLKKWILRPDHTFESYPYKPLNIVYQFVPGPLPNDRVNYWLLRRKPERAGDCLYMQFVLQLSNHVFQIVLPMHIEDRTHIEGRTPGIRLWPNTWAGVDHQVQYGRSGHKLFDMSGTEQVRGETTSMTFHYDQLGDTPSTTAFTTGAES